MPSESAQDSAGITPERFCGYIANHGAHLWVHDGKWWCHGRKPAGTDD